MHKTIQDIPLSILDLIPITEGDTIETVLKNSLKVAQHAEKLGYHRYWVAEHHNSLGLACSATVVLVGYIAGGTQTMRVGSGGIMLPNHAPLVVAEQFGTLASLYPNRIDLGLGRAPGTDPTTAKALRRNNSELSYSFSEDILALQTYFSADNQAAPVRAIPGEGTDVPIWVLGSSNDSARLAAGMGLPYAFASHFAPTLLSSAIEIYRKEFRPSRHLAQPYVMACVYLVTADTDAEAERLNTSYYQSALSTVTGRRGPLKAPVDTMNGLWNEQEEAAIEQMSRHIFLGGIEQVKTDLSHFQEHFQLDEIMITCQVHDPIARMRSHELVKSIQSEGQLFHLDRSEVVGQ